MTTAAEWLIAASTGSAGPTASEIATAILAAAQTTPIHSNIQKVNDVEIKGAGTASNPWNPV